MVQGKTQPFWRGEGRRKIQRKSDDPIFVELFERCKRQYDFLKKLEKESMVEIFEELNERFEELQFVTSEKDNDTTKQSSLKKWLAEMEQLKTALAATEKAASNKADADKAAAEKAATEKAGLQAEVKQLKTALEERRKREEKEENERREKEEKERQRQKEELRRKEKAEEELKKKQLSTPQPEFKNDRGSNFKDCLLLHRLLIEGKDEEVLRRRQELSPSILKHTCQDNRGISK